MEKKRLMFFRAKNLASKTRNQAHKPVPGPLFSSAVEGESGARPTEEERHHRNFRTLLENPSLASSHRWSYRHGLSNGLDPVRLLRHKELDPSSEKTCLNYRYLPLIREC